MTKPILVIKFGSASITHKNGELDEVVMVDIARQVAAIHGGYHIVLVSSGAVAAGKKFVKNYAGTITERKAAAAVGNPILLNKYAQFFAPYGIAIAQSLCERQHFSNRDQFLQLKKTYEDLWANDIIPIANENDVVSNLELKFSDNDELATLIAVGFGASILLFSTSVPGVLDADGQVVKEMPVIDKNELALANKEKSALGLGGMVSKLTFARLATRMGIKVVIFGIRTTDGILQAIEGKTGTLCHPQKCSIPARKKWLGSGSLVTGSLQADSGACKAIQNGHSLLAVGVKAIVTKFESGEVFEILDENQLSIAVARAKVSSDEIWIDVKTQKLIIAHADDIVLL
ncbi:glutamate 5-kinase [Mucilaginibacter sp. PPCGB 2223]|uniref:glutamate 5-kinase n=1 Tax=Mucilaginibacter sp. PPCGB 2223 TaxID=1886027 RepID=UPI0008269FCA|nr:glutamate 5-kinase [Mucilaginibacter sp. PPCGB 2223]OCX53519.1 glutamate 5-kinase [Mucilaginibacter sp. PPCGB 2223]